METVELKQTDNTKWSQRSESIAELAKALCKTQATVEAVKKDANNPFFKSKYADLASVWAAIREALTSNGLSVLQEPASKDNRVQITTTLMHISGEYIRSTLEVVAVKQDPQGIGSAITYARRYALGSIIGIAPEDDDGNAASQGKPQQPAKQVQQIAGLKTADQLQAEAVQKAMGDDKPNFKPSVSKVYTYDLREAFRDLEPSDYNKKIRFLEKKLGIEVEEGIWDIPEYIGTLSQYIKNNEKAA
jgi:hypothetical protein